MPAAFRDESPELIKIRTKIMRAERAAKRTGDRSEADDLRRQYAQAKVEDQVRRIVAEAPPFTQDQRDRLRALFQTAGELDDLAH
jgi:hypothetical protein